jgi:hypothetical protein
MDEQPLTVGEGPESNATAARGTAIITWAGLIIIYLSVAAFGLVGFLLYRTAGLARADLYKYTPEFMVSAIGVFAALLGVKLVRAGGLSPSDPLPVVNPVEWRILSAALTKCDEDPIGQYIRLSSLTGATGFFTKLGLSGLPLATIALTLFFALGSLVPGADAHFYDLTQLTLGAFIGSFVQKQVGALQKQISPAGGTGTGGTGAGTGAGAGTGVGGPGTGIAGGGAA